MPNLVGIWSPDLSQEAVSAVLNTQLRRVRVRSEDFKEQLAVFSGFGMALQDHGLLENGSQPAYSADGDSALLLDGEINNAAELQKRFFREPTQNGLAAPELCLRLIALHGHAIARFFNGFFCLAVYERTRRRLTLISDRYGARPLYYVRRQHALLFGTEMKALAAADPGRRKIDEVGVMELFCYGTHFMDRTWMDGYLRLPPATVLTVDIDGMHMSRYWTYRYDEGHPALDQQTYASVFGILLDRAVERRMAGTRRIGIFLSGGYDSRSVAAAIRTHHRPLPAFTFGLPRSRDVRFAAMLAGRLGLDHQIISTHGPYLYDVCRAIVWRTEGMISFANTTSLHSHGLLKQHLDIILTGFLGEFSGSHTWPQLLLARSRSAAIRAVFYRFLAPGLRRAQRIFQPEFLARNSATVRERFNHSFVSVENEHPMDVADVWNFSHLQPRGTFHAPAVDRHRFEMRAPHTDNDLVDFLLTIRPMERIEQRVYKKMIAYSYPEIRDIPCTNSARPIEPNFAKEYAAMTARYASARVYQPLRRLFYRQPELGRESRDMAQDFRTEAQLMDDILHPLLHTGILSDSIFNPVGIEELVSEHYRHDADHTQVLGLLVSLGLAMKYFLHDDFTDVPGDIFEQP